MQLIREVPDVGLAARFDGEPLVQSFRGAAVARPDRPRLDHDRARRSPCRASARPWVAGQLAALQAQLGTRAFNRALLAGVRLHADTRELALAA